jgi:hypothetical protein
MGHMNFDILVKISTKQEVRDVQKIIKPLRNIFKQCQHGKQSRVNFKTKEYETSNPLEVVHTNICGPTRIEILQGERYFMLIIDDYTRMTSFTFIKNKYEAFDKFKDIQSSS